MGKRCNVSTTMTALEMTDKEEELAHRPVLKLKAIPSMLMICRVKVLLLTLTPKQKHTLNIMSFSSVVKEGSVNVFDPESSQHCCSYAVVGL